VLDSYELEERKGARFSPRKSTCERREGEIKKKKKEKKKKGFSKSFRGCNHRWKGSIITITITIMIMKRRKKRKKKREEMRDRTE
jgi:hypothetical protein